MPSPHNHSKWAKCKTNKTAAIKKCKEESKKSGKSESAKKVKPNDTLKLALGNKLAAALVTQHHMTQTEAELFFDLVYKDVVEDNKENKWDQRWAVGLWMNKIFFFFTLSCSSRYSH